MMDTQVNDPAASNRGWATSSLISGLVWLILAVSPTFLTTLLGLPFGGYAIVVGLLSRRSSLRLGDRSGARRAGWGMGLGCAGFFYLLLWNVVIGGLIVAAGATFLRTMLQGTPTP